MNTTDIRGQVRYTIYLGKPFDMGVPIDVYLAKAAELFGGVTVSYGEGLWQNDGRIDNDAVARIEILAKGTQYNDVLRYVEQLRDAYNQAAVMVVVDTPANVVLVHGDMLNVEVHVQATEGSAQE